METSQKQNIPYKLVYLFSLILFSCSLFRTGLSKKEMAKIYHPDSERLNKEIYKIEGEYENNFDSIASSKNLYSSNFNNVFNWKRKQSDTTTYKSANIKILDDKFLQLTLSNNLNNTKTFKIKYYFDKNGVITLENRNLYIIGIPIILGGFESHVIRILGVTELNQLILSETITQEGGILICLPCDLTINTIIYYSTKKT